MNYCQFRNDVIKRMAHAGGGLLPDEYQQVEYLQSSGTQYINTGVVINTLYNLQFKVSYYLVSMISNNLGRVCGAHNSTGYDSCVIWDTGRVEHGSVQKQVINTSSGNIYNVEIVTDSTNYTYITNNESVTGLIAGNPSSQPFYIFTLGRSPLNSNNPAKIRLYSCSLFKNGVDVFNFIPCYRKSDTKPGMYDLVTNTFFTNSGTGEFTVGNNV